MTDRLSILCDESKSKQAAKIIVSMNIEKIINTVASELVKNNEKVTVLLKNIFSSISDGVSKCENVVQLFKTTFKVMNNKNIEHKIAQDVVGLLMNQFQLLDITSLMELCKYILKYIDSGKVKNERSLELFAKTLHVLSECSSIPTDEGDVSGDEFRRATMSSVCKSNWTTKDAIILMKALRNVPLNEDELKEFSKKALLVLNESRIEDAPSLIHETLLFFTKINLQQLLNGIINYFYNKASDLPQSDGELNALLENNEEIKLLKDAEGDTLVAFHSAVKHSQELGKSIVKYIKNEGESNPKKIFTSFCLSLMLSISEIHRLEEQVMETLRNLIVNIFTDDIKRSNSKWLADLFPDAIAVEDSVKVLLKNSDKAWQLMGEALIRFSFILLDCYQLKLSDKFAMAFKTLSPTQRAFRLGASVVTSVFKDFSSFRKNITHQLLDIIVMKATCNIEHYLELLSSCIATVPQMVLDCLPKFKEAFDYVSIISLQTTEKLLRAVLPLMKVSMSVKDSLIMILKKSMFSKQVEARKIAVTGFLLILKHFKIQTDDGSRFSLSSQVAFSQSFSCSQVDINTQGRYNVAANEALCLEVIGNLKKSLTQHGDVRKNLYNGIYDASCKNPRLSHSILELLYQQFVKYYVKEEDITPPLKVDLCSCGIIDKDKVSEPLGDLLCALQLCTKKCGKRLGQDDEEDELLSYLLDDCEEALSSLSKRMAKTDLEDFQLDKTAEYDATSDKGKQNQNAILILPGIYEVLIEYVFMNTENISEESSRLMLQLFAKYQLVNDVIKEKVIGKKGKSGLVLKNVGNYFSYKCLSIMISSILCNTSAAQEPALNVLRNSLDFVKFVVSRILNKLHQVLDTRYCDGAGGRNIDHIFRHSIPLAKSFLKHINGDCLLPDDLLKKDKGQKLSHLCLDGLCTIVGIVCTHTPGQIQPLLKSLDFHPDVVSQNDAVTEGSAIFRIVRRIQRMVVKIICSPDDHLGHKEALILINMINYFLPHLDVATELAHVYTWYYRLATENCIDDLLLSKTVLTKLLSLHHQIKGGNSTVTKISQDIHSKIGDMDDDIDVENRAHFMMITEKTASPTCFIVVMQHIESILEEVDWALVKLKSLPINQDEEKDLAQETEARHETLVISMSQTLIGIVLALHELTQTAFSTGAVTDAITKVVTKLYTTLGNMTKYHLTLYMQKNGNITSKFERLVKLTGSHLSQQVYNMITFVQDSQSRTLNEHLNSTRGKEKKKTVSSGKTRALKESRSIPNLIYSMEQFERYLIQLSKKSKIDLMENIKRSTARDFRINAASVEAALQTTRVDESTNSSQVSEHSSQTSNVSKVADLTANEENIPTGKRAKLQSKRQPLKTCNNS